MTAPAGHSKVSGSAARPGEGHGQRASSLVVEDVRCGFDGVEVLRGLSLAVPAGAVTCLLGPSGCGKTTLLRIIAGVEHPTSGRVLLDGEEVSGPKRFVPPERRRIGLMFQDYALFPHLSVTENVRFGLRDRPRNEARAIAAEAIAAVGLAPLADKRPGQLSGGEQQRAALARALAPSPRAILMDEPFSNLDRKLREELREAAVGLLRQAGITTVIVTHDPDEALALADEIALLAGGSVLQCGTGEDVYHRPVSPAAARALSDICEVPGRFRSGRIETCIGSFPARVGRSGQPGLLCVRPEGILLGRAGEGARARVVGRAFRGAASDILVAVDGLETALRAVVAGPLPAMGETVSVTVDASKAHVFEA